MNIHVAYTVDIQGQGAIQFQDQLLANMHSLRRTKREEDVIHAHIAYANISADVMANLNRLSREDFKISFVKIPPADLNFMQSCTKQNPGSQARAWCGIVYARLFLCNMLPSLDRCIYLDTDMLIRGSLHELWNTDLQGKKMGLVMGIVPEYGFNSGVIVFDFAEMRKDADLYKRLCEFMQKNARNFLLPDQTVINRFFANDICPLPFIYNYPPCPAQMGTDLVNLNKAVVWHFYNQSVKPFRFDDQGRALVVWNAELDTALEEIKDHSLPCGNTCKANEHGDVDKTREDK